MLTFKPMLAVLLIPTRIRSYGSAARSTQDLLCEIFVIEVPDNPETGKTALIHNARHLPDAMNSHLIASLIGRGNKNLDPDLGSSGRKSLASDERSIERNIAGKATLRMIRAVVPVEDNGKAQLVSHSSPPLRIELRGS